MMNFVRFEEITFPDWFDLSRAYAELQRQIVWKAVLEASHKSAAADHPVFFSSRIDGLLLAE